MILRMRANYDTGTCEDSNQLSEADTPTQTRNTRANCGCPQQILSQKDSRATFRNLDSHEEYFPTMASLNPQAFFGLPPKSLRPKALEKNLHSNAQDRPSSISRAPCYAYVEDYYSDGSSYGISGGGGLAMEVDLPPQSPSPPRFRSQTIPAQPTTATPSAAAPNNPGPVGIQTAQTPSGVIQAPAVFEMAQSQVSSPISKL